MPTAPMPPLPVLQAVDGRLTPSLGEPWNNHTALLMARLSWLAYAPLSEISPAIAPAGFDVVAAFSADGLFAFLAVGPTMATLVFRGTANLGNWGLNLRSERIGLPEYPGIQVHAGFYGAWADMAGTLAGAIAAHVPESLPLYLTGHSLGAAIAQLAGIELKCPNLAAIYTFGSPRLATLGFDKVLPTHHRVVHQWDLVPAVPPTSPKGYLHAGDPRLLDGLKPEWAQRRDRDLVPRVLADLFSLLAFPFVGQISSIGDHMIWTYVASLEAIVAAELAAA